MDKRAFWKLRVFSIQHVFNLDILIEQSQITLPYPRKYTYVAKGVGTTGAGELVGLGFGVVNETVVEVVEEVGGGGGAVVAGGGGKYTILQSTPNAIPNNPSDPKTHK
jgi:hypothetical protein